jgi:hypothetical protein
MFFVSLHESHGRSFSAIRSLGITSFHFASSLQEQQQKQDNMGDFEGKARELIPAQVRMISGCQDSQTSADVSNVSQFELPDPAGARQSSSNTVLCLDSHISHC